MYGSGSSIGGFGGVSLETRDLDDYMFLEWIIMIVCRFMARPDDIVLLTYAVISAMPSILARYGKPGLISRLWLRTPC